MYLMNNDFLNKCKLTEQTKAKNANPHFELTVDGNAMGDFIDTVDTSEKTGSPVRDVSITFFNNSSQAESADAKFLIGANLKLTLAMGTDTSEQLLNAYVTSMSYSALEDSYSVTAVNAIGYFLKNATFATAEGDYNGNLTNVVNSILALTDIANYVNVNVQTSTNMVYNNTAEAKDEILDHIVKLIKLYGWKITDDLDGTVYIGDQSYIDTYKPIGKHKVDEKNEAYSRNVEIDADAVYSKICVSSNQTDASPLSGYANIVNYSIFKVASKKIKYLSVMDNQTDLASFASNYASAFNYLGVSITLDGILRPNMTVGDVAYMLNSELYCDLGIVTEVRQKFDREKGFSTDFTVTSGGEIKIGNAVITTAASADTATGAIRTTTASDIDDTIEKAKSLYKNIEAISGGKSSSSSSSGGSDSLLTVKNITMAATDFTVTYTNENTKTFNYTTNDDGYISGISEA